MKVELDEVIKDIESRKIEILEGTSEDAARFYSIINTHIDGIINSLRSKFNAGGTN